MEAHLRFIRMKRTLEHIIKIFNENGGAMRTNELYERLRETYGFNHTKKNLIETYFPLLEHGAVSGVEFFRAAKRGDKHRLIDHRKILNAAALEEEKRIYIKLALESLEDLQDISKHHDDIARKLHIDRMHIPFYIKPENYERLQTDKEEIETLERAIKNDLAVVFDYKGELFHVEAYRMVNFEGIWYLYGKDINETKDNPYKTWLLEYIDHIEIDSRTRHSLDDDDVEAMLENAYDANFIPDNVIETELFVRYPSAEKFRLKSFFPNQTIVEENEKGIRIKAYVSTHEELLPEVLSFLPDISIIKPLSFKRRLLVCIRKYLEQERKYSNDEYS
jgi:predicted DNA-binding transcriptional regulator YafY